MSGCRTTSPSPSSWCTATTRSRRCCATTRPSPLPSSSPFFGDSLGKHVMLGMDEPEHRRYRSLVSAAFSQKALARRQDELVERRGERSDRPLRRARPRRPRPRVQLPVSDADHRRPARSAARGLSAVPALVDLAAQHHRQPGARDRGLERAAGLLRPDSRGPARGAPRRPHQQPRATPRSTASASPTRRSSRSCACCSPPASRPRTARPGTCSSGCSPTPSSSTPFAPIGR